MSYYEKIIEAGNTIEVSRYYSWRTGRPEGMRRKKLDPTPERIKRANMRRRADRLRQLMNANFNDNDYWSLTLTYRQGEEPETIRGVRDDAADFVKRLRKCAKLFGVEPRYIYVIGAGIHRRHVHITVNSLPDMAILTGCWIHGHVSMTKLYSDGQYRDLADYYIKNAMDTNEQEEALGEKPGQWYVPSRNLEKPKETKRLISAKEFRNEPRTRKGYYVEKESIFKGFTESGFPLLRYTLIKERQHEGDKVVHIHQRQRESFGQSESELADAVCEGRAGEWVPYRSHGGRWESKERDT
ncbi:MAG: hypothetical protein IJR31_00230 [Lachnospiraceae bacterium]|nr:hypothetical protein [Lachnospiraceae bacterium]